MKPGAILIARYALVGIVTHPVLGFGLMHGGQGITDMGIIIELALECVLVGNAKAFTSE